jgi:hypothetical protein
MGCPGANRSDAATIDNATVNLRNMINFYGRARARMILPYNSGPYPTRQTVSCWDLTAVSTGHLWRAYGHHSARRNPYGLETRL